jgi:hypothetical protein
LGIILYVLECRSLVGLREAEGEGSVVSTATVLSFDDITMILGDVVAGSSVADVVSNCSVGRGVAIGSKLDES